MSPRVQAGTSDPVSHHPDPCGRLLVDQGGDSWDPVCTLAEGHPGPCWSHVQRSLNRSQRDTTRPEFGSAPHDDRVLAVVLVMPEGVPAPDVRVVHVEPNTPHGEAFWQDAGRPWCGQAESVEVTAPDECVQPPCPTGVPRCKYDPECDGESTFCNGPDHPDMVPVNGDYVYRWRCWGDAQDIAARCNAFWTAEAHDREVADRHRALRRAARAWHAREDLIERLGPLPEPIPRREP